MNPAPDSPEVTLYRPEHPTPTPTYPLAHHPGRTAELTPQQLALLAALIHQQAAAPAPAPAPAPVAAPVATADARMSGRAKDTALMVAAGGTGLGAASAGVGVGAGLIASASGGLMTAAVALAIASGSVGAAAMLLRTAFRRRLAEAAEQEPTTHITQNITATGLFGKANGTIHHR
ncbi:hypothetical protein [Streptomyces hoynatensis]|uniref:Uncharacterized protein n=1 Tax=Streptomyces hoynatensis TaxID=1141874 RepID=A0A3A9Z4B0_9ACTN|nr:hypothetical protein [Streptomyces hoynatensis]RKN43105.1 hypothetical protein D7294_11460 [Streptomyces hoynatensis]